MTVLHAPYSPEAPTPTPHPKPQSLNPTRSPNPQTAQQVEVPVEVERVVWTETPTRRPKSETPDPRLQIPDPRPQTPYPQSQTLSCNPQAHNRWRCPWRWRGWCTRSASSRSTLFKKRNGSRSNFGRAGTNIGRDGLSGGGWGLGPPPGGGARGGGEGCVLGAHRRGRP